MKKRLIIKTYIPLIVFLFVFMLFFSFLIIKNILNTSAASTADFQAGNIISDYVMSDYNSMSENDIWNFLKSKNSCNDRDLSKADRYTTATRTYHIENGHFVCLADETFDGESAAHIIWQAAQDYRINPQVLIVLLQKEQGLITDTWPNSIQYRSATGYGCPDTAACSAQYYGFRNQIRNAAELYRWILDNGSRYYSIGWNYIQFNPNGGCGGSDVYIENRATAALYQYTPYQPNASALAAGYGTGDTCGAYGNRNFFLYFSDWFGNPREGGWRSMDSPRYLQNKYSSSIEFFNIKRYVGNDVCLADNPNEKICKRYSDYKEVNWEWRNMETPRYLQSNNSSIVINLTPEATNSQNNKIVYYTKKTILPNGQQCLISNENSKTCAIFETLEEMNWKKEPMAYPRNMKPITSDVSSIDPTTLKKQQNLEAKSYFFKYKYLLPNGQQCLISDELSGCVFEKSLASTWTNMDAEREMSIKSSTYKINSSNGQKDYSLNLDPNLTRKYVSKTFINSDWCLRTEYDQENNNQKCIMLKDLQETWNKTDSPKLTFAQDTHKVDVITGKTDDLLVQTGIERIFPYKFYYNDEWCYRTEYDTNLNTNFCVPQSKLKL